jgi:predicted Rossmann fold nucleotide-binding protein DprA/Smf involved in DNA uptake
MTRAVETPLFLPRANAWALGNPALLDLSLLGIFSSVKCPAALILKAHDTARGLSASGRAVIGGFQSPVEKEMLTVLLRGQSPIVICPARGLAGMRIPSAWRPKLARGELLVLSPFPGYIKRPRPETIHKRNALAAQLASELLIIHAEPGGKIEALVNEAQAAGKKITRLSV